MNNQQKIPPPAQPKRQTPWLFWFMIIAIIIIWLMKPAGKVAELNLPYSEFKSDVQAGKVKSVVFDQNRIRGDFTSPVKRVNNSKNSKDTTEYKAFQTVSLPVDDRSLVPLLETHKVEIQAKSGGSQWLKTVLIMLVPWILIIGYFVYAGRKMQRGLGGGLFDIGKSKARLFRKTSSTVTYQDVAGLQNVKQDLQEIVEYLREPEKFTRLGADIPKGILLMGPPGTGKTLLARATAGEADVAFFSISGSEFIEMFVGVGASRVRDMFGQAKNDAPSIIFIDEIDSVGRSRGTGLGGGHDEREQTLNQILSEMDGFAPHESVVVMAATNRPDVLDAALIRPGRFDRQIVLDLPQKEAREEILKIHTRHVPLAKDVDLTNMAARTVGFSGADLKNLVNEAALLAGRDNKHKVHGSHFDAARDKILLGAEREEKIEEKEKRTIAFHEAGHALVAKLLPDADPLQKVTIIPRGQALGVTEQVPQTDRHNLSQSYLEGRISVALAGRAAEKLVFDDLTSGAASDLKNATKLARMMVTQWGMSDKVGPVNFRTGEEHPFLGKEILEPKDFSEATAKLIDEEIKNIIMRGEFKAFQILKNNMDLLNILAQALIQHETLENHEIEELISGHAVNQAS